MASRSIIFWIFLGVIFWNEVRRRLRNFEGIWVIPKGETVIFTVGIAPQAREKNRVFCGLARVIRSNFGRFTRKSSIWSHFLPRRVFHCLLRSVRCLVGENIPDGDFFLRWLHPNVFNIAGLIFPIFNY